jgi:hypothetical protein
MRAFFAKWDRNNDTAESANFGRLSPINKATCSRPTEV